MLHPYFPCVLQFNIVSIKRKRFLIAFFGFKPLYVLLICIHILNLRGFTCYNEYKDTLSEFFSTSQSQGEELKNGIVIFVCTFDPFGQGRHYYSFENVCLEDTNLKLNDGTKKILLNTKGILDDVNPNLKKLLDFIDGQRPEDEFTQELSMAVENARHSKKWRLEYMNLELKLRDKYREGENAGKEVEKIESAKRMLADGKLSLNDIALYSSLPIDTIKQLKMQS